MLRRARVVSVGLCLLAAIASAQAPALKRAPKVGDTATYKLTMVFTLFADEATYTAKLTEKVADVQPAGTYTVERTQTEYKVLVAGEEGKIQTEKIPKQSVTYTSLGDVVEIKGDLVTDSAYRIANLSAIRLSGEAPAMGATWTRDLKEDQKSGVRAAKALYKIDGEEKIGETDCWVASFDYLEADSNAPARSVGHVWLKKTDSTMMKLVSEWTNAPIPGAPQPLPAKVLFEREN